MPGQTSDDAARSPRRDPALVVFDLDGTLIDTLHAIADAMNAVLRDEGLPEHHPDAYRRFAGDGATMLIRRATAHRFDSDPAAIDRMLRAFRERDEKLDAELARPYPGVMEMLDALAARGHPAAILSNKEHAEACKLVSARLGADRFIAVEGAAPGKPLKPDPTLLLLLTKQARRTPRDVVYVGDTDTDMRTGRNAGVFTVGCAWGFRDPDELRASGADVVIESPLSLPAVIDAAIR